MLIWSSTRIRNRWRSRHSASGLHLWTFNLWTLMVTLVILRDDRLLRLRWDARGHNRVFGQGMRLSQPHRVYWCSNDYCILLTPSLPHSLTRTSLVWFFIITGLLLFCGASASASRHQLLFPCVIDTALCICRPFAESPQVLHRQQTLSLRWWNSPCLNAFTHTVGYAVSCDPASFRRQSDLIYNLNGIKTEIN